MKLTKEQIKEIRSSTFTRSFALDRGQVNEENRTVEISFSSEDPYLRWFGYEILGHDNSEVDIKFLNSGRAPLLADHDPKNQIGVIEKAWLGSDRKGRALVRFGKNARADEIFQDILDGIKGNVSVGYQVNEMKLVETDDEKGDTYRVTKWAPLESSIVAIPADATVGVGRSIETIIKEEKQVITMTEEEKVAIEKEVRAAAKVKTDAEVKTMKAGIRDIYALGEQHGYKKEAAKAVEDGKTVDQFRGQVLDLLEAKGGMTVVDLPDTTIGLGKEEQKQYSFLKLIRAMASGDWKDAGFERECAQAFEDKSGRSARGVFVPPDMFKAGAFLNEDHARALATRDLNTGVGSAGGYSVEEQLMSSSFVDLLRNTSKVLLAGARTLNGLVGDIDIPKQTGGATAYWVGEGSDATESQQALGQIRMSPKTIGCLTDVTRRMMLQSSLSVEAFIRMDFAIAQALKLDLAAINGTGAGGQPLGILNTTGIGAVTINAQNVPDWGDIVDIETEVSKDNALTGSLSYMVNSTIAGKMKQTEKASSTGQFILDKGATNGYPVHVTEQMPSLYMVFGNWADLIIGFWSGLDVTVDTNTLSASGGTRVVAFQDADIIVRHAESFCSGYHV